MEDERDEIETCFTSVGALAVAIIERLTNQEREPEDQRDKKREAGVDDYELGLVVLIRERIDARVVHLSWPQV
jgi:hypothetical protein